MKTHTKNRLLTWLLPLVLWLGTALSTMAQLAVTYSTSGTWVAPTGVTSVTVECWGGGGRGAGRTSNGNGGGGGGGGAYVRSTLTVVPGNSYTVTVGAGSTSAAAGGDSWFSTNTTILAKGGNSVADNVSTGATGGSTAASIGTVKFAGGNGATTTVVNGGGGGSSAGTASAGVNGTVSTGGVAPAGGGNGGNGFTGGNGDGSPGSDPGGGGGGARRSGLSLFDRFGGAGGDGRVVISYGYTEGTCLTASSTIPDNGCAANNRVGVTLPKSGLPTVLGNAPGNARITSLELIVAHAFNADLDITLTSPTGQTRNMVLDRFNAGDNLGNPGTCAVLNLVDGGAALTTTSTNNVTGNYAPEETLAGFTGDPNGNWTISICDDGASDVGSFRFGRLNFCTVPSVATVGSNQSVCVNGTTAGLGGNTPAFGTGAWSVVSGGTGTFSSSSDPNATFTHTGGAGPIVVRWTISSGSCTATTADVTLTVVQPPTTATVGGAQTICANGTTTGLGGNTPSVGTGAWSIIGGGTGTFSPNNTTPNATFTHTGGTVTALRWTISNAPCTASSANVSLTINQPPTTATVGGAQTICANGTTTGLGGNTPSVGTGAWSIIGGGTGTFSPNNTTPNATFTHTGGTVTALRWTISNAPCTASSANVSLTINQPPTTATVGGAQTICANGTTTGLGGNTPSVGTGAWSIIGGGTGTFSPNNTTPNATFTHTGGTVTALRWTISNAPCTASSANVSLTINQPPTTATVGGAQTICANGTTTGLGGNTPSVGTGAWSIIGGGTGTFSPNNTTPNATFTHTGGTVTALRWTISNAPCTASSANVSLTINQPPTTATVGGAQTICANGTTTGLGGNTPSVGTGAWSIIGGGTGTFSPNNTTPNATFTHTGGTVTALRWTISNSPCTASSADVSITINQAPTTSAAGPDQTVCVFSPVTLAANAPVVGTGAWSVVSGPSTNASQFSSTTSPTASFTNDGGVGTYTLRWTISNSPCATSTDDVLLTFNSACAWYSRASGTLSDNVWSLSPSGPAGPATWGTSSDMIVQSGHTITVNSAQNVGNITVDNGGTLVLGAFNLTANGTAVDVNGTLTANDNSTLTIAGSGAKTLDLSATTSFWNLTCNASSGTTVTGNATIRNTLLLSAGNFNCTGNPVVLESNATRTGRLGPVGATASYTGDLTVNRYIPAGATNWRMMGSPVAGQTVNQWRDDYITAGFPGSHYPTFASPVGSGILWPSIRHYDETNTGAGVNDGLIGVSGIAQSLAAGKGFASWCGSGFATTTAFTVDVSGNPHVANTPITLPMTYTNTGNPAADGWNMVSNPLASPIAFDQISRGANVEDYITYFDPATGNNATYDISLGSGTNGGTNIIQSSQGFWLKATGAAVTTTVEEADKVENNGGGFFGGDQVQTASLVRLQINSAINQYSDETLVVFSDGQPETTNDDVPKFIFAHPDAPQIATQGDAGEMIAINAYGPYTVDISIPVMVNVSINGNYTITATGLDDVGLSCLRLEDLATNTITPLVEGTAYTFAALANDDPNEVRFLLHASAPMQLVPTNATCNGRDDGSASVTIGSGPVDILWMDAEGAVLLEQNNVMPGTSEIMALEAGEYRISINGNASCSTLETVFTIEEPTALEATAITEPSSCPQSEDGTIDLTVLGGEAPYTFAWSNEAVDEDLTVPAGTYTVTITDANGCSMAPQEYVVGEGEGPDAGISLETFIVMVGQEVVFAPNTLAGVSNIWDFGDGTTSTDLEGVHTYTVPGTYTVTLTVDDGSCTSTASIQLDVETTTGLPTVVGKDLNAWVSGDHIVVDHNFSTQAPVFIRIFSTGGQLVQEHRVPNAPTRITLPTNELATGIWMVRVSNGNHMRTFSLPVVH